MNALYPFAVLAGLTLAVVSSPSHADEIEPVHGVLEAYLQSQFAPGHQETLLAYSYASATVDISPRLSITTGAFKEYATDELDENYIRAEAFGGYWRVGRFRTEFGLSSWADQYYFGLPHTPLIRTDYYPAWFGLPLDRVDTGVEYQRIVGNWQFTGAVIDPHSGEYQLTPATENHIALRAQTYFDSFIVGLNMLESTQSNNLDEGNLRMYDIDIRWTAPAVQVRAEAVQTNIGPRTSNGYYADISYHTLKMPNTTFLARAESVGFTHNAYWDSSAVTLGVRQVLTPHFTLEASQCWGNNSDLVQDNTTGTTLQLVSSTRF